MNTNAGLKLLNSNDTKLKGLPSSQQGVWKKHHVVNVKVEIILIWKFLEPMTLMMITFYKYGVHGIEDPSTWIPSYSFTFWIVYTWTFYYELDFTMFIQKNISSYIVEAKEHRYYDSATLKQNLFIFWNHHRDFQLNPKIKSVQKQN